MSDDDRPPERGVTRRLAGLVLPLGLADLVIAILAGRGGQEDHIGLYALAGLTFLLAPLLMAGHFLGGDILAAAELRRLRKLYAERFPFAGPRRDWRLHALILGAVAVVLFISPRDRLTGAALLAVAVSLVAVAASYVTRVWPDERR